MFSRSWKKVPTKPPNVVTVVLLDGCFCITHPDVHGNFCSKWIRAAPLMLQSALTEPASMQKCSTLSFRNSCYSQHMLSSLALLLINGGQDKTLKPCKKRPALSVLRRPSSSNALDTGTPYLT